MRKHGGEWRSLCWFCMVGVCVFEKDEDTDKN